MCLVHKQQRIQSSSVLIFKKHCELVVVATIPVLYYSGTWLKLLSGFSGDIQCVGQKIVRFTDMLNKRKWTNNRTVVNCHVTYWQPSFHIARTAGLRQRFHDATTKTPFVDHNVFKLQAYICIKVLTEKRLGRLILNTLSVSINRNINSIILWNQLFIFQSAPQTIKVVDSYKKTNAVSSNTNFECMLLQNASKSCNIHRPRPPVFKLKGERTWHFVQRYSTDHNTYWQLSWTPISRINITFYVCVLCEVQTISYVCIVVPCIL